MTPQALLIELRSLNIRVRVDGDAIRCKAPDGVPAQLADALRLLKPGVLELLRAEENEVAWRTKSLGADLLNQPAELMPSACSYCGSNMPGQQSGKCVLCCLAAAKKVIARLNSVGSTGYTTYTTYPMNPDPIENLEQKKGVRDMSHERREAA